MRVDGDRRAAPRLELVQVVVQRGDALLEALAFPRLGDDLRRLGGAVQWVSGQDLPVVEDALRERLTAGVRAEIRGEA